MFNKIEKLSETEFNKVFGNIFENGSWIAKNYMNKSLLKTFRICLKK